MKFAVQKTYFNPRLEYYTNELVREFQQATNEIVHVKDELKFVLNVTDIHAPKSYKRKHQQEMVITMLLLDEQVADIRNACFAALVKTLSNMVLAVLPAKGDPTESDVYYTTPESGFVCLPFDTKRIYQCILPLISSHFVLRNKIEVELPESKLIESSEINELVKFAHALGKLGHLPAPFPLEKYLDAYLIRQLFRLYEMKGLSYGNLSVRSTYPGFNGHSFWMTARGSDKANLQKPGHDILLVTGYDKDEQQMKVSVPPDYDPRVRVSVDAIEHFMIYSAFPGVGAIVHIHAWMNDILSTTQNYPCGTFELAKSVVELLKTAPVPEQAVVGLKNHGLTITGHSLTDVFSRIKGKLQTKVPMFE
jgi:hypothetical protein